MNIPLKPQLHKLFLGGLFLFYITLVSLSIPKTAPIANTAPTTFFIGVQTNGVLPDFGTSTLRLVSVDEPVYGATISIDGNLNCPPVGTFINIEGTAGSPSFPVLPASKVASIMSPFLKTNGGLPLVEKSFVKIYFAITNFFSKCWHKYTNNFLTFYKFEKFDRAWAKSFNSFLLPLKFIRSNNGAMEHNVLQVYLVPD